MPTVPQCEGKYVQRDSCKLLLLVVVVLMCVSPRCLRSFPVLEGSEVVEVDTVEGRPV